MQTLAYHLRIMGLTMMPKSEAELKNIYRRQISRWHPDRHQGVTEVSKATERSQKINESYNWLVERLKGSRLRERSFGQTRPSERPRGSRDAVFTPGFPDKSVFEHFVKSSHIASLGYDFAKQILYVKFKRGGHQRGMSIYRYFSVPKAVFDEFLRAPSPGHYLSELGYRFERIV